MGDMNRVLPFALSAAAIALAAAVAPVSAQDPRPPADTLPALDTVIVAATPVTDTLPVADTIPREGRRPLGAFFRAMAVPGWGHVSIGEYRRGAVYFALQASSWAMLGKTIHKLNDVKDRERRLAALGRDSLDALMAADTAIARELEDPAAYEAALLEYPGVSGARALIVSRQRHRQDWIVYTVVFTFAAAIDAYVTAHLSDFPAEVTAVQASDGGVAVGLRVPVGAKR
ncbi:MAG TPA: hypothetical protein VK936_04555 [Longimicrobiales bacterium]|nr:hypothetical protein [Longimicrobiales bacterium]